MPRSIPRATWRRLAAVPVTVLAGAAVLTVAPALASSPARVHAAACANEQLTVHSNLHTVTIKPCSQFTITLSDCLDCGYQWKLTKVPSAAALKLLSSRDVQSDPGPVSTTTTTTTPVHTPTTETTPIVGAPVTPIAGAPATFVTTYRAVRKAETKLVLGYFGPGRGSKAMQSFTLTVVVR